MSSSTTKTAYTNSVVHGHVQQALEALRYPSEARGEELDQPMKQLFAATLDTVLRFRRLLTHEGFHFWRRFGDLGFEIFFGLVCFRGLFGVRQCFWFWLSRTLSRLYFYGLHYSSVQGTSLEGFSTRDCGNLKLLASNEKTLASVAVETFVLK